MVTGGVTVTADPTGLTPGAYTGTVTVADNGVNAVNAWQHRHPRSSWKLWHRACPSRRSAVWFNNGTFASGEPLAQGDIAAVFGNQFSFDVPQSASSLPLATTLDSVQVLINGKAAPVYYVSPTQINFEIPIDAATGDGTLQVVRNEHGRGNLIYVDINAFQVPRFISYLGSYAIMTTPTGALTGVPGSPAKVGDTIVMLRPRSGAHRSRGDFGNRFAHQPIGCRFGNHAGMFWRRVAIFPGALRGGPLSAV